MYIIVSVMHTILHEFLILSVSCILSILLWPVCVNTKITPAGRESVGWSSRMGVSARGLGEASASNYGYPYRQTINLGNEAKKLNTTNFN